MRIAEFARAERIQPDDVVVKNVTIPCGYRNSNSANLRRAVAGNDVIDDLIAVRAENIQTRRAVAFVETARFVCAEIISRYIIVAVVW